MKKNWLLTLSFEDAQMQILSTAVDIQKHIDIAVFKNRDCTNFSCKLLTDEQVDLLDKSQLNKMNII